MAKQATKSALDLIREIHGSGAVFGGNENVSFSVSATSTGSLNLDQAIGCEGIPDGRLTLWSGPESSGKTLGSLCYAKKLQGENKRILFIDAECTWDHNWASSLGLRVDSSWMMVAQESSGSQIFDLLCGKPANKTRKKAIPGILSEEILKQMESEGTPLGAIILDSINAVAPPLEMDMDTGDQQIGSLSRFLPPMLRRLTPLLKQFNIPMISICQARTNIGQMRGDPLTVSGGKALMHAASLWIDSRKINGTEIYEADDKEQQKPIGHQVRAKIRKNKVGAPGRQAELTIYYTKGVDLRPELIDQGLQRGLIKYEGNSLYYSGFEGGKVVGKNNAIAALFNNRTLAKRLLNDILSHRQNSSREAKKSVDYIDSLEEDVVVGKVSTTFAESKTEAKLLKSEEAKGRIVVQPNGTRVDRETGEIISRPPSIDDEEADTPPATASSGDEEEPEGQVATIDSDDEDSPLSDDAPVATAASPVVTPPTAPSPSSKATSSELDVDSLSLKDLKEKAKEAGVNGWYKLSSDELRAALKKKN